MYSTGAVVGFIFAGLVSATFLAAAFYVGFAFGYFHKLVRHCRKPKKVVPFDEVQNNTELA